MLQDSNELYHHGILGQRWGVRRFQNEDGTRTTAGKKREREAIAAENQSIAKSSKGLTDNQKALLKTAASIGIGLGVAYGQAKLRSVLGGSAFEIGKNVTKFTVQNAPKVPMYAAKGFTNTAKVGKAALTGGVKTGKALMNAGGTVVKVSGRIVSKAIG